MCFHVNNPLREAQLIKSVFLLNLKTLQTDKANQQKRSSSYHVAYKHTNPQDYHNAKCHNLLCYLMSLSNPSPLAPLAIPVKRIDRSCTTSHAQPSLEMKAWLYNDPPRMTIIENSSIFFCLHKNWAIDRSRIYCDSGFAFNRDRSETAGGAKKNS